MQIESIFRIILPALVISFIAQRGYYVKNRSQPENATLTERRKGPASMLATLLGSLAFISLTAYVINPNWLSWASLSLPFWLRWVGAVTSLSGFALLQWAQNTLGENWSDAPRMMRDQKLVTNGPYRWVRHPIYSAFLLILGSIFFISANWFIGISWLGMTVIEIISRISFEESLMIEYFGDQYREYMKTTGRLLPRANI